MKTNIIIMVLLIAAVPYSLSADKDMVSEDTKSCIECHSIVHPGIVKDWENSLHSKMSFDLSAEKGKGARRVTSAKGPDKISKATVGCAECHMLNSGDHKDTFEHNGYDIHVVVTPKDCSACHALEAEQYSKNIMSNAYANLMDNPVYMDLAENINGIHLFSDNRVKVNKPDSLTTDDSCLYCHGTKLEVRGTVKKETDMGEMSFPVIAGWPSQGVGRLNPDKSKGACTSCHPRHSFSLETARKPATCSECHKGPDVPAYKVYMVSKHGNIYSSQNKDWDFKASPWTVGKDFTAPTCAVCHISEVVNAEGDPVAKRSHQMNDRLSWRLMGIIYAHPHPVSPDTTIIKNKMGLPLPTELTGQPVSGFLIDKKEQEKRRASMKKICSSCHSSGWVEGHFARYENAINTTNEMTLTATNIILKAWESGAADGLDRKESIFNETIERMWVEQWLFYANTVRYASAMAGADYGVFADGRWYLSKNIQAMKDWLHFRWNQKCGSSDCRGNGCADPAKCPGKK